MPDKFDRLQLWTRSICPDLSSPLVFNVMLFVGISRPVIAVMLLIPAMVLPAASKVLCIGPDGHAAIELNHPDGGCDDADGRTTESTGQFVAAHSDDCIDLSLATMVWIPRPEWEQLGSISPDLLLPIYLIGLTSDASLRPSHFPRWTDQGSFPALLLSLRSTVLLL